jgi:hypothetical protein
VHLALHHDWPNSDWAWGADFVRVRRAPTLKIRSFAENWTEPGAAGLFIEHKDVAGLKVRLTARNPFGTTDHVDRTFFEPRRGGAKSRTEWSFRERRPTLALEVSGAF